MDFLLATFIYLNTCTLYIIRFIKEVTEITRSNQFNVNGDIKTVLSLPTVQMMAHKEQRRRRRIIFMSLYVISKEDVVKFTAESHLSELCKMSS